MTQQEAPSGHLPRVLALATTLPARSGDGTAAEFVLTLAQGLAERFRVLILAPRVPGGAKREMVDDVAIRRFAYFPRRWEDLATDAILPTLHDRPGTVIQAPTLVLSMIWHTLSLARRSKPELIHAHWIFPGGLVALIAKRLLGIPYVLTVHGADAYALQVRAVQPLKRLVLREAASVLPVSRDIADSLGGPVGEVLPMGVDFDSITSGVGQREPVAGRLFFVGRLAEKKGVDVLLESLVAVPECTLHVGGDGPERTRLESQAAALGLSDRVRFLGRLDRGQILKEMKHAAAVVLPSRIAKDGDQDGTPVVMMEAVAAGVPVIASELGGLGEYLDDGRTGILAKPADVDSLTVALQRAVADPEGLERLGPTAREVLAPRLSVSGVADRYADTFDEVLQHRTGSR